MPFPSLQRSNKDFTMNASTQAHRLVRRLFARTALFCACTAGLAAIAPLAHADALDTIAKSGVVRIGVFEDYPPFGSIGPDMKPQGYDIDMATLIGKALNAKVELVQVTGDNRMAYLADRKTDMLLSVGQTPERAKVIDFSNAYAPYYLAVFGPKSLAVKGTADLAGKSVAVARGTLEDLSVSKVDPAERDHQALRRSERRDRGVPVGTGAAARGRQRRRRDDHRAPPVDRSGAEVLAVQLARSRRPEQERAASDAEGQ